MPAHRPLAERLWEKIDIRGKDDCWLWTAGTDDYGYGRINKDRHSRLAHRTVYQILHDVILDPKVLVCHSCDNPPCCNPNHLFEGTHKDNIHDMIKKGRAVFPPRRRGSESASAILVEEEVVVIKKLLSMKMTHPKIAKLFDVSPNTISNIAAGYRWKHVKD